MQPKNQLAAVSALRQKQGVQSINVLRMALATQDGETVTIGPRVYEIDTTAVAGITAGRVRVDCSGGSTVAAQATLTIAEPVTNGDTMRVGATTYTFATGATTAAGVIGLGGSEAATKLAIPLAINGGDGFNTANASASCAAAFTADTLVFTARIPGTVGNAVVSTQAITHANNIWDADTFGTTTAGVDPTADESVNALALAINTDASQLVTATKISANEMLIVHDDLGTNAVATTETLAGSNNAWAATTMFGGAQVVDPLVQFQVQQRVPLAREVEVDNMHFLFPFTVAAAQVHVRTTASGIVIAWNGGYTITGNRVQVTNEGNTDWAATSTVLVRANS